MQDLTELDRRMNHSLNTHLDGRFHEIHGQGKRVGTDFLVMWSWSTSKIRFLVSQKPLEDAPDGHESPVISKTARIIRYKADETVAETPPFPSYSAKTHHAGCVYSNKSTTDEIQSAPPREFREGIKLA